MTLPRRRRTVVLPVGVDVGADGLRLVQLRVSPAAGPSPHQPQLTVAARYAAPLPTHAAHADSATSSRATAAAAGIRDALRRGGFVGREVVTALPPGLVHIRTFRLPTATTGDRDAVLRRQARQGTPFGETEPLHTDSVAVGEARQGRDVRDEFLSVAARDADVRDFLEAAGPGVTVRSLQAQPYALYRAVAGAAVCPDPAATHAAVHVGEFETFILIGVGPRLRVVRRVDVGAHHLDRAVAVKLSVTPAESRRIRRRGPDATDPSAGGSAPASGNDPVRLAIHGATRQLMEEVARETAVCVRYHVVSFRGPLPRCVRLRGCDASDPVLRALLSESTGLPVDSGGGFDAVAGWAGSNDDGGWTAAFGLALAFAPALPASTADRVPVDTPAHETVTASAAAAVGEAACA